MNPVGRPSPFDLASMLAGARYAAAVNTFYWQDTFQPGPRLEGAPRVTLRRPVVFVPGWGGWGLAPERFEPAWEHLTAEGANGGRTVFVRDGRFYTDRRGKVRCRDVGPGDRVFAVVFTNPHAPPEACAEELGRDLQAIRKATGQSRVDVEAFSLGGTITRLYLDRGGRGIRRLLMLATPNRGTRFGDLAREVLARDVSWAMALSGISAADRPALDWLGTGHPGLRRLNQDWERQRSRVEAVRVVGGGGLPTPEAGAGDGLVEEESLALPGVPVRILPRRFHLDLFTDPEVFRERAAFFGWGLRD